MCEIGLANAFIDMLPTFCELVCQHNQHSSANDYELGLPMVSKLYLALPTEASQKRHSILGKSNSVSMLRICVGMLRNLQNK